MSEIPTDDDVDRMNGALAELPPPPDPDPPAAEASPLLAAEALVDSTELAPPVRDDVVPIYVALPRPAIGALIERGFLATDYDGNAAVGEALLAMLGAAYKSGVRATSPDDAAAARRAHLDDVADRALRLGSEQR